MSDIVHGAHSGDGFPLCWSLDEDGPFTATRDDDAVTCPACLEQITEINAFIDVAVRGDP